MRSHMNGRESIYVYDHTGRLLLSHKLHDGEAVERLYLESGQALAKWTGTALTYLHTDHLGTPIRGTHGLGTQDNAQGLPAAVGEEIFHDLSTPFGLQPTAGWHGTGASGFDPMTGVGSNCGVMGFTTHAKDCETGLQYMQARHYDAGLVRFTSGDPVTFMDTGIVAQINRYNYTANDSINLMDPNGECPWCAGALFGAVAGGIGAYIASGGEADFKTILVGAAAGAAVGAINPFAAASTGASTATATITVQATARIGVEAVKGGLASAAGQIVGGVDTNLKDGQAIGESVQNAVNNIDKGAVLGAAAGAGLGKAIALSASHGTTVLLQSNGQALEAVMSGLTTGAGELVGDQVTDYLQEDDREARR